MLPLSESRPSIGAAAWKIAYAPKAEKLEKLALNSFIFNILHLAPAISGFCKTEGQSTPCNQLIRENLPEPRQKNVLSISPVNRNPAPSSGKHTMTRDP
jgi:hypothetical protein